MKVGAPGPMMPQGPGGAGPADPTGMVEKMLAGEKAAIEQSENRKQQVVEEKNDFASLSSMISELGSVSQGMKTPSSFKSLKIDSSHPELIEGSITGPAAIGSYEMEVRGLAKADKIIDVGFPDVNETPVGFGYMQIQRDDGEPIDVTIDPGSTLKDVASKINDSGGSVRASIIDTGFPEDPFKLVVASTDTGKGARISFDADTTFLETKKLVEGQNLDVMFDDVAVTRASNELGDLLEGIQLNAKSSQPGTRVKIDVTHDIDKTAESVSEFAEKYNQIAEYANKQYSRDPAVSGQTSIGTRNEVRSVMRKMQSAISQAGNGSFQNLSQIGITTNPKTGTLDVDEAKIKEALTKDYEGVTALFAVSEKGEGLAGRLSNALKSIQDPINGSLTTRTKGLDKRIQQQDQNIARQSERLEERREKMTQRLGQMNQKIQMMESQGAALSATAQG